MNVRLAYLEERLRHKIKWLEKVRFSAACVYSLLIWSGYYVFAIDTDYPLVGGILLLLFLNACSSRLLFHQSHSKKMGIVLAQSLLFDIILVSLLLFFTGGYANPFSTMLLLYVFLTAIALDERWTWVSFITASISYASLFVWYNPVDIFESHDQHSITHGLHAHHTDFSLHLSGMLFSFILLGGLFSWFFSRYHKERARIEEELFTLKARDLEDQRLIGLANFCAGAAHELGSPLATCRLVVDDMQTRFAGADGNLSEINFREDVNELDQELNRVTSIVKKMRSSAEVGGEVPKEYSLSELVEAIEDEAKVFDKLNLEISLSSRGTLFTFKQGLVSSILILIKNAAHSYESNTAKKCVKLIVIEDNQVVKWKILDTGSGMDAMTLKRLGEPFFTTKDPGKGMGLGVYLARSFSRLVGGSLDFYSVPGKGTEVVLVVPKSGF